MRMPFSEFDEQAAQEELFHAQSLDLNEYPSVLRNMRKCRSFRADLSHKLEIIIRAHGGWGNRGMWQAADKLRVSRHTLRRWFQWETAPGDRLTFERIDNVYENSLETLAKKACEKQERKKRN